jgi:hypothetical protein
MKPYIITYEINDKTGKSYQGLFDEIKKSIKWWHYIANSWIILTDEKANDVFKRIEPHIDSDVNLLVIELGSDRQGWLSDKAWDWIKKNIPR